MKDTKPTPAETLPGMSRRQFLNTAALTGLAGAGLSVGLAACSKEEGKKEGKARRKARQRPLPATVRRST